MYTAVCMAPSCRRKQSPLRWRRCEDAAGLTILYPVTVVQTVVQRRCNLNLQAIKRTSSLRAPIMLLTGHAAEIFTLKFNNSGNLLACELPQTLLPSCIERKFRCIEELLSARTAKQSATDACCAARSRVT